MPMLSRNLPMMRQMRRLANKATLKKGQQPKNSATQTTSVQWPRREENFAAAQIHQQKQPIRTLSNRPVSLVDMGAFRPVTMPDRAYVGALSHRNNMAAAQNAKGRPIRADEQMIHRMDYRRLKNQERMDEDRYEAETDPDAQYTQEDLKMQGRMDEDHDYETDLEVRSVREAVFGPPDDSDEDNRLRAQADAELLRRVTAQKVIEAPAPTISRKVIQPYNSYRSHRTRWAEFRHGMIYGRSSF